MKNGQVKLRLFEELVKIAEQLFDEVRCEQGRFQSGICEFKGRNVLLINTHQPLDERVVDVAKEIACFNTEGIYIKPAVRAELERYSTDSDNYMNST